MEIGISRQRLVEVFNTEFQQNVWNGLWNVYKIPFTVLCELRFIMDQYGWIRELPDKV
jgi:hypothetical protein